MSGATDTPQAALEAAAREEYLAVMHEHEARPGHVLHVTRLALELFDGLVILHGLGPRPRLLLAAAGHLHDIGHKVIETEEGHHKESARLIRAHPWKGFTPLEVELIAQIARYHRKAMPDFRHEEFRALPDRDRETVLVLSSLLRLADGLDRSHRAMILGLAVEVRGTQVLLHLQSAGPAPRELAGAREKADLARIVFRRDFDVQYAQPTPDKTGP